MEFMDSSIYSYTIKNQGYTLSDVKNIIHTYYDYGEVKEIKQLNIGETNYSYILTISSGGTKKKYFAQLYNTDKSLEALKYEIGLRSYIMRDGNNDLKCALCHNTKNGGYTVECYCSDINRVRYFCLYDFLDGITLLDREVWAFGRMSENLIKSMAKGLATFHKKAFGYVPPGGCKNGKGEFADDLLKYREVYIEEFPKRRNDPKLNEYYNFFEEYQPRIVEILDKYRKRYIAVKDYLPVCICHMDPSVNNWIFDSKLNAIAVCDLDFSREIMRLFDICLFYIDGFCNPNDPDDCLNLDQLLLFINAYDEAIEHFEDSPLGVLTKEEREIFPDIFQLVAIKYGFNNIWDVILTDGFASSNQYNLFWGQWSKVCIEFIEKNMDKLKNKLLS